MTKYAWELGVLLVALLLGSFVVATYANAQELGPDVKPCEINLTTGENCFGEKVIPVDAPLPLSPHNHLPCTDSVSAGASLLAGENEEEVYDLGCKSKRK